MGNVRNKHLQQLHLSPSENNLTCRWVHPAYRADRLLSRAKGKVTDAEV